MSPISTGTRYRPDIDGLRAVAVFGVLGYHAFPEWAQGGFTGVDVFFVISGYLITLNILNDLQNDTFSLTGFYGRRVRRIFPALLLVLATVLFLAWFTLLESQFRYIGRHTAAGATFSSNWFLWKELGYFDGVSDKKPLLHLWSLAIEEQFYICWPVMLYFAWKKRVNLVAVMLLVIVFSFGAGVRAMAVNQESAFYLLAPRAWELALGGLLAVLRTIHKPPLHMNPGTYAQPIAAGTGIVCVMAAFFLLDNFHPYPGVRALLPTIGTALLIWAGPGAWLNRTILSSRLLAGCGLISFPLYLWHWPLLSIARSINGVTPPREVRAEILLGSAALAFLSYRLVERPVRFGSHLVWKTMALLVLMGVVGVAGFAVVRHKIIARSESYSASKVDAAVRDWDFPEPLQPFVFEGRTFYQTPSIGTGRVVSYFGDSQMMQLAPRIAWLAASSPAKYPRAAFLTQGGCPPFSNSKSVQPRPVCDGLLEKSMAYSRSPAISAVVVSFLWRWRVLEYAREGGPYEDLMKFLADFHRAGKRVYVILDIPAGQIMAPESMIERRFDLIHWQFDIETAGRFKKTADVENEFGPTNARVREAALKAGAEIIDPVKYLCSVETCPSAQENGEPRYWDDAHLRAKFVREHATFVDHTLTE